MKLLLIVASLLSIPAFAQINPRDFEGKYVYRYDGYECYSFATLTVEGGCFKMETVNCDGQLSSMSLTCDSTSEVGWFFIDEPDGNSYGLVDENGSKKLRQRGAMNTYFEKVTNETYDKLFTMKTVPIKERSIKD